MGRPIYLPPRNNFLTLNKKLRIVFIGTPEFAVQSLRRILEEGYNVVGVITAPDKPAGRGQKLQASPVKEFALSQGLKIMQPANLKDPEFIEALRKLKASVQLVIAFRMLPEAVWNMPPLGTFNLHASYLPAYRGAAPINRAIMNGETETGITTFFLKHEIDTGDVILQEKVPIYADDDAGELHDRLMLLGAELVIKSLRLIESGNCKLIAQPNPEGLPRAPKIFKNDCRIDWDKPGIQIHNLIRGLSPVPAAFTLLNGLQLKIFKSTFEPKQHNFQNGTIIGDAKGFGITCPDGIIHVHELQLQGKKRMKTEAFLRGYDIRKQIYVQ